MPAYFEHLYIAKRLASYANVLPPPEYYLGAILPDAVNIKGFAPQEMRYAAHLRDKTLAAWEDNINVFYEKNKGGSAVHKALVAGYAVHCLTDLSWDEFFEEDFEEDLIKKCPDKSKEDIFEMRWSDHYALDYYIYKSRIIEDIIKEIPKASAEAINNIPAEYTRLLQEYITQKYHHTLAALPPVAVSMEALDNLAQKTAEKAKKFIF